MKPFILVIPQAKVINVMGLTVRQNFDIPDVICHGNPISLAAGIDFLVNLPIRSLEEVHEARIDFFRHPQLVLSLFTRPAKALMPSMPPTMNR